MELRVAMCQTGAGSAGVRCVHALSSTARALSASFRSCPADPSTLLMLDSRREFWAKNYAAVKAACPKVPILVRESSGTPAKLTGVYGAQSLASSRTLFSLFFPTHIFLSPPLSGSFPHLHLPRPPLVCSLVPRPGLFRVRHGEDGRRGGHERGRFQESVGRCDEGQLRPLSERADRLYSTFTVQLPRLRAVCTSPVRRRFPASPELSPSSAGASPVAD
jgi:hypothetical protein